MRIYLDVCCLNRTSDDQTQDRIHFETEAILTILEYCTSGNWTLVSSEIVDFEILKNPNEEKKRKALSLKKIAKENVQLNDEIELRGFELEKMGFKAKDALHLASAEYTKVDVLLTTDDQFMKKALAESEDIAISVSNPLNWLINLEER